MPTYLEIAVNIPHVSSVFHYHLPAELEGKVRTGHLVTVPFGPQTVQGVVLGSVETPSVPETRPVLELLDAEPVVTTHQLALARYLEEACLASLAACIGLMLPPGLGQQADAVYTPQRIPAEVLTGTQARLWKLLQERGPLRGAQIDQALPRVDWRAAARSLMRRGYLSSQPFLPTPRVRPKYVRTVQLACPPAAAEQAMSTLAQPVRAAVCGLNATAIENINPQEGKSQQTEAQMAALGKPGTAALARRQKMLGVLVSQSEPVELSRLYAESGGNLADVEKLTALGLARFVELASPVGRRRQAILRFLMREPGPVQVAWVYAESGGNLSDLEALAERSLVILGEGEVWRDPVEGLGYVLTDPPLLTHDQRQSWEVVQLRLQQAAEGQSVAPILLHGVTGSGKTEIYLYAVQQTLRLGRQAIVLVPEIALTPQTVRRFAGRFPGQVGLLHSGLSEGERYDTWRRARAGSLGLVVGPRSALFTPFANPGLIVVDECHDDSYYQAESPPHYHTHQAAVALARLCGAVCILGSATPDITSFYAAQEVRSSQQAPRYEYLQLPARILAHQQAVKEQLERLKGRPHTQGTGVSNPLPVSRYQPLEGQAQANDLPPVHIVDMRTELKEGNRSIFSRPLQQALAQVLQEGQQAILFLNRRGAATYVFCRSCGYILKCPRCDIPLTYHLAVEGGEGQLRCHYCGYQRKMPGGTPVSLCPECKSPQIRQYGTGTQRVEAEVQALFPQAHTLRWDYETTRHKNAHEIIMSHFVTHRADVLVGTQMLAKGLDLPLVTLVGVVLADVGLSLPDYRAAERTFQVLTQVAGRAGRSPLGGQVIMQTFMPEHYVIRAAARHDYLAFYRRELEYRRQLGYPPFNNLVRLEYRHTRSEQAEQAAQEMAGQIQAWLIAEQRKQTRMIGPAPCLFGRISGYYRWQIILCGPDPASVLRGRSLRNSAPGGEWRVEINPPNLL